MKIKRNKLHELGAKCGTDKHNEHHSHLGESYLNIYERYFHFFKDEPINILELGVRDGSSLKTWREYFPNAQVYGVDLNDYQENPHCVFSEEPDRIHFTIASQDDKEALWTLAEKAGGFDIIIDDCSHISSLIVASFDILYSKWLREGGYYVIEDLRVTHLDLDSIVKSGENWNGELTRNAERGVSLAHDRERLDQFFSSLIKKLDMKSKDIRGLHFWSQLAIIMK